MLEQLRADLAAAQAKLMQVREEGEMLGDKAQEHILAGLNADSRIRLLEAKLAEFEGAVEIKPHSYDWEGFPSFMTGTLADKGARVFLICKAPHYCQIKSPTPKAPPAEFVNQYMQTPFKQEGPARKYPFSLPVVRCARCGRDHHAVEFREFINPPSTASHWGICPEFKEPILLVEEATDKQADKQEGPKS